MMICVTDWIENIVGKGENAGYQHFLLFPQCFQKPSLSGSLKVGTVWKELNCQQQSSNASQGVNFRPVLIASNYQQ